MAITAEDAAIIKGMALRGDKQMWIASYFGINQARVSEIAKGNGVGKKWRNVAPITDNLPPPGPYVLVSQRVADKNAGAAVVIEELLAVLSKYRADGDNSVTAS